MKLRVFYLVIGLVLSFTQNTFADDELYPCKLWRDGDNFLFQADDMIPSSSPVSKYDSLMFGIEKLYIKKTCDKAKSPICTVKKTDGQYQFMYGDTELFSTTDESYLSSKLGLLSDVSACDQEKAPTCAIIQHGDAFSLKYGETEIVNGSDASDLFEKINKMGGRSFYCNQKTLPQCSLTKKGDEFFVKIGSAELPAGTDAQIALDNYKNIANGLTMGTICNPQAAPICDLAQKGDQVILKVGGVETIARSDKDYVLGYLRSLESRGFLNANASCNTNVRPVCSVSKNGDSVSFKIGGADMTGTTTEETLGRIAASFAGFLGGDAVCSDQSKPACTLSKKGDQFSIQFNYAEVLSSTDPEETIKNLVAIGHDKICEPYSKPICSLTKKGDEFTLKYGNVELAKGNNESYFTNNLSYLSVKGACNKYIKPTCSLSKKGDQFSVRIGDAEVYSGNDNSAASQLLKTLYGYNACDNSKNQPCVFSEQNGTYSLKLGSAELMRSNDQGTVVTRLQELNSWGVCNEVLKPKCSLKKTDTSVSLLVGNTIAFDGNAEQVVDKFVDLSNNSVCNAQQKPACQFSQIDGEKTYFLSVGGEKIFEGSGDPAYFTAEKLMLRLERDTGSGVKSCSALTRSVVPAPKAASGNKGSGAGGAVTK